MFRESGLSSGFQLKLSRVISAVMLLLSLLYVPQSIAQMGGSQITVSPSVEGQSLDAISIAPGDMLNITVFDTPELTGPARVNNTGSIDLPLIGSVSVSGLSPANAAALIRQKLMLGNFLKDPQVTINFADLVNHTAVLLGEVSKPGAVFLNGNRTLWEVIGAAGGVSPIAGKKITIVSRAYPSKPEVINIDWGRDLAGQPNPTIHPGDTIQVSRAGVVYVVGQVGRQGGYPITYERLSVSQVVALAEGIKYTSKASHTQLIRHSPTGISVSEVDIPSILQGKSPDVALEDKDILYVPNSVSKVVLTRGIEAAIAVSTSLIILSNQH
jgi:polysaccharide export outer membrane protein